jgi:nudix-type nucleoside diphosphatase (YffH/AdpP family)
MSERIVGEEIIHTGWTSLTSVTVRLDDGTEYRRLIEHHGDAAAVLPYDPERRTAILVRQLRTPLLHRKEADTHPLEAPAGIMDEVDAAETVRREAMEEAGVQLDSLEAVATVWAMPGVSTERVTLFLAPCSAASRVGAGGGLEDEHEHITVEDIPLDRLWAMAQEGGIIDMKTLLLVYALKLRRPELFG